MKAANNRIDYSKLFGFESVGDLMPEGVDFQDDALAAKLGAKVGNDPQPNAPVEASKE